jgi:predicted O-methyltransferase YrrM
VTPAVDIEALLAAPPALHVDSAGNPVPFESDLRILRLIARSVGEGSRTLETGGGLSTLVFTVRGCEHTCVVPWTEEVDRIRRWCADNGVPDETLAFATARSEEALPALGDDAPLDLVLIDGGHGFPTPFIDWWYAGRRLRPGGLLIIDDTHLWTGAVLRDFLDEQPGWTLVERLPMRAAVFRREDGGDAEFDEWVHQPYVVRRSYERGARNAVRKAVKAADLVRREGLSGLRAARRR